MVSVSHAMGESGGVCVWGGGELNQKYDHNYEITAREHLDHMMAGFMVNDKMYGTHVQRTSVELDCA
jgi:hypothetical protein